MKMVIARYGFQCHTGAMPYDDEVFEELSAAESLKLLESQTFGRLVVRRKDDMDLFPLNYVVHEGNIYFRSAEGSKLFSVQLNPEVLFEGDYANFEAGEAWSVIVKGRAEVLKSNAEIAEADSLPLKPWLPTLKYNYVRIVPEHISGRTFNLGEEPERY